MKKKLRLIIFILIFIVISPIVVLYAKGDIFTDGWNILSTGGIYVSKAPIGSEVLLNSKHYDIVSFFNRDILIKNLRQGTYDVEVKKDGYNSWSEKIKVTKNIVSDARIFILPNKLDLREITEYLISEDLASSSNIIKIENQEYDEISTIFASTTKAAVVKTVSTTTSTSTDFKSNMGTEVSPIMLGKIGIWLDGNSIYSKWFGGKDSAPKYFCDEVDCKKTIKVFSSKNKIKKINFLPQYEGVVVAQDNNKIFAIQIENYANKKIQLIYQGKVPEFKIINDSLYIKDKDYIAEVVF